MQHVPPLLGRSAFVPSVQALRVLAMAVVAIQNLWTFGLLTERWPWILTAREGLLIFVAISGFVLSRRLLLRPGAWWPWLRHRLFLLYSMYWTVLVTTIAWHRLGGTKYPLEQLLFPMTGLQGLFQTTQYWISGPWWYVALLLQIYLVFPLVFHLVDRAPALALVLGAGLTVASDLWSPARMIGLFNCVDAYVAALVCGSWFARVCHRGLAPRALAAAGIVGALLYLGLSTYAAALPIAPLRALAVAVVALAFFELVWLPPLLPWLGGLTFAFFLIQQEAMKLTEFWAIPTDWRLATWLPISLAMAWGYTRAVDALRARLSPAADGAR